jgi:hypothetical protein
MTRTHTHTHTQSVGFPRQEIGQSQQSLPDNTQHSKGHTSLPPAEFETAIPASEWRQIYAILDFKTIN